eukprot:Sspe_Gene.31665::Locus_15594_Transcript_1_1_Confidence_1.000_Length_828::g.31665::m.31665
MKGGVESIAFGVHDDFPETKSFYVRVKGDEKKRFWSARKGADEIFDACGRPVARKREREGDSLPDAKQLAMDPKSFPRGCIVEVSGVTGLSYQDIKTAFTESGCGQVKVGFRRLRMWRQ